MGMLKWRELEIENFESMGIEDFFKTSEKILRTLETLGLPIRVFEKNILKPEKSGILQKIEIKQDSVELTINSIDTESNKKGRKDHVVIISEDNDVNVGLPVFA